MSIKRRRKAKECLAYAVFMKNMPILIAVALLTSVFHGLVLSQDSMENPNYPTPNVNLDVMIRNPHWDGTIATSHNGGILYGPQDTILVFGKSCDAGADIIEVDVRITGDGHLILFHDEEFDFLNSTGSGLIRERNIAYVRSILAVSLIPGVPNQPIPTFREALQFLRPRRVCLNVEPKDDVIEQIILEAGEEEMLNNILIQAKSPEKARLIRSLNSKVGIIARFHEESDIDKYAPYHPEVMELDPDVSDQAIARIKSLGIKVQMDVGYLKEMDFDEESWRKRIQRGVNVALTDFIPNMVSFLRRNAFNMGNEARPRSGSQGLTGYTYIALDSNSIAPRDGRVKSCRIFMAGEGTGKIKIFRAGQAVYELICETPIVPLRQGLNIVFVDTLVKKGDLVACYIQSGDVEADRNSSHISSIWYRGDAVTMPKDAWIEDTCTFSVDAIVR